MLGIRSLTFKVYTICTALFIKLISYKIHNIMTGNLQCQLQEVISIFNIMFNKVFFILKIPLKSLAISSSYLLLDNRYYH